MPLPKNINTYADVQSVLNTAHNLGGAHFTLSSPNEAIRWRQRAYYLRKLLFERDGFSKFDTMKLTIKDEIVSITFDAAQSGTLKSLDGKKVKAEVKLDKELFDAAETLVKELTKK